jgi:hypothetical protein
MKWLEYGYWMLVFGVSVVGLFTFMKSAFSLWYATTPLMEADLSQVYLGHALLWLAGFLVCAGGLILLLAKRHIILQGLTEEGE